MKWLFLTTSHHQHAQQMARALLEHDALGTWLGGLVFSPRFAGRIAFVAPKGIRDRMENRVIRGVPFNAIKPHRSWEASRLLAHYLGLGMTVEDFLWEKGEFRLDARGAALIREQYDGIVGFEHGCLHALRTAREMKRRAVVAYASAHHSMRERWVDPEYAREPEWCDPGEGRLLERAAARDERRDLEAQAADLVIANSPFTRASLINGGVTVDKIATVPLGLPPPQPDALTRPRKTGGKLRVIYVGTVALHKGFHYLQRAVAALKSPHLKLDVYGTIRVRKSALIRSDSVCFHGMVRDEELARAYSEADVLVFPTLCDGFGQVIAEALSWGVPVICSENAGAVHFVRDGDSGFRVPAADVAALVNALKRCLDERERLQKMREAAIQTVKEWTWEHFRGAWYQALERPDSPVVNHGGTEPKRGTRS